MAFKVRMEAGRFKEHPPLTSHNEVIHPPNVGEAPGPDNKLCLLLGGVLISAVISRGDLAAALALVFAHAPAAALAPAPACSCSCGGFSGKLSV